MKWLVVISVLMVMLVLSYSTSRIDYFQRGNDYAEKGEYGMAIIMYNNTINDAYFAIGLAEYNRKNYSDAIENFTTVIENRSKDELAYLYRGQSYIYFKKLEEAQKDLEKAKELGNKDAEKILEEKF